MQKDLAERISPLSLQPALKKEGFFETNFTDKGRKNSKFFQLKFGGLKMSPIFAARSTKTGVLVKAA